MQNQIYRHIDVCLNRIQEGIRVVDEIVRFHLDDEQLLKTLKELRHNVKNFFSLDEALLLTARDSENDAGFNFTTATEGCRSSLLAIARASLKRIIESLRILEEYSKLPELSCNINIEKVRQHMYTTEKEILLRLAKLDLSASRIYPITPEAGYLEFCETIVEKSDFVQLRLKNRSKKEIIEAVRRIKKVTDGKLNIIINDHIDICLAENLGGVHLGQDDLPMREARKILGHGRIIGISTHNVEQAQQAERDGADYIGIGPAFETATKDTGYAALGLEKLGTIAGSVTIPSFAIGGIGKDNFSAVIQSGVTGAAVISALTGDICKNYAELLKKLEQGSYYA